MPLGQPQYSHSSASADVLLTNLPAASWPAIGDLLELGKARLSALVVLTTLTGYLLASVGPINLIHLLTTLLGTALAAFGANAFNQIIEVPRDLRMHRTRNRPLPANRITTWQALAFAIACSVGGPGLLALFINPISGCLALICLAIYVTAYTPLKPRTSLNTLVGGICGAIPPMIGWAAITGGLEPGAWILGMILFMWQMPHFLALAWLYREDYERGGFVMLPHVDPHGSLTGRCVLLFSFSLIPATLMLAIAGVTGLYYAGGALLLGLAASWLGVKLHRSRSAADARRVFLASVIYLPILLALMVADRAAPRSHADAIPTTLVRFSR